MLELLAQCEGIAFSLFTGGSKSNLHFREHIVSLLQYLSLEWIMSWFCGKDILQIIAGRTKLEVGGMLPLFRVGNMSDFLFPAQRIRSLNVTNPNHTRKNY